MIGSFVRTSDGGRLHHEVRRSSSPAAPLLLLGRLGGALDGWGEFRDLLAARRSLVCLEFRGSGRSSRLPLGATTRLLAKDAAELLEGLGMPRADVFGSSFGGMVATRLALDAPRRVTRLMLASTPARGRDVVRGMLSNRLELVTCLARGRGAAEACLARQVVARDAPGRVVAELREQAFRSCSPRRELLKLLWAASLHDASGELGRITQPTLVLAGSEDPLLCPDRARELSQAIPGAHFELIDGAGHDVTTEAPRRAAERVLAFLDEPHKAARRPMFADSSH